MVVRREDSKILQAYWKEPKPFCESLKANFLGVEYEWKDILFWRVRSETVSSWVTPKSMMSPPKSTYDDFTVRMAVSWIARLLWVLRIARKPLYEVDYAMELLSECTSQAHAHNWDSRLSSVLLLQWNTGKSDIFRLAIDRTWNQASEPRTTGVTLYTATDASKLCGRGGPRFKEKKRS